MLCSNSTLSPEAKNFLFTEFVYSVYSQNLYRVNCPLLPRINSMWSWGNRDKYKYKMEPPIGRVAAHCSLEPKVSINMHLLVGCRVLVSLVALLQVTTYCSVQPKLSNRVHLLVGCRAVSNLLPL